MRLCAVPECGGEHDAKGYCQPHYRRFRRYGDPLGGKPSWEERFSLRVQAAGPGDCWPWTGKKMPKQGYGVFYLEGAEVLAHRYAYRLEHGEIPEGLDVDHLCHNHSGCLGGMCKHRLCCNPLHLQAVAPLVNRQRSHLHPAKKTHCPSGHAYDLGNTYTSPKGSRRCRRCARTRDAARQPRARKGPTRVAA